MQKPRSGLSKVQVWSIIVAISVILGIFSSCITISEFPKFFGSVLGSGSTSTPSTLKIGTKNTPTQGTGVTPTPTQASPTQVPTLTPSPTQTKPSIAVGQTLYETTNFNGWSGSSDWTVRNGMLYNDGMAGGGGPGDGAPSILAPYNLDAVGVSDYAVEVKVQVVRLVFCFAITIRGTSTPDGWHGYIGGVDGGCWSGEDVAILVPNNAELNHASFTPGNSWHTYRLEVKGDTIRFLVDGVLYIQVNDTRYFSSGQVGLWSLDTQLIISSFKIIAL